MRYFSVALSRSDTSDESSWAQDNTDEPSLAHSGIACFNCQQDIVGACFRCVDCTTADVNICSNCETAGLPGNIDAPDGGHRSSHIMLKIPAPLKGDEVQYISRLAHGLRLGRDHADSNSDSPGDSPLMRSSPGRSGSVSLISPGTPSNRNRGEERRIEKERVHHQICNSCNQSIVGIRYFCLNCPSKPFSFNLCSNCEIKSYEVHNPMHVFLKIPWPVNFPGPLKSEIPLAPILYREPAGPTPRSALNMLSDPVAYLHELTHPTTLCDLHMTRIVGTWYRCAFCAKDLCTDCEIQDTHESTHAFLVFKAPVDMQAFRQVVNIDDPRSSLFRGNIYYPQYDE